MRVSNRSAQYIFGNLSVFYAISGGRVKKDRGGGPSEYLNKVPDKKG